MSKISPVMHVGELLTTPRRRGRVQLLGFEDSLTKQCFKDECDINLILKKYRNTGAIDPNIFRSGEPRYGDFTNVDDYYTACNKIADAQEAFDALPSSIRTRFHNDPGEYVAFCCDEANRDELIKLGLVEKPTDQSLVNQSSEAPAEGGEQFTT